MPLIEDQHAVKKSHATMVDAWARRNCADRASSAHADVNANGQAESVRVGVSGKESAVEGAGGPYTVQFMSWLPRTFVHPIRAEMVTGHHLRPIRATDVDLDYPAVMGSRERLWSIYGDAWGWPPATMTYEQDREDLARHEAEIESHRSFNYALFDAKESCLLGCVYVDPPEKAEADAEVSWWVVDSVVGTELEHALDLFVPGWIAECWPFQRPRLIGRDLSWNDWRKLPELH